MIPHMKNNSNNKKFPKNDPFAKKYRVNEQIRVREVRVIDSAGNQLGVLPINAALEKAKEVSLDLVEIAPDARPPVCKIVDFGKMRYEFTKKQKQMKKNNTSQPVKTVKLSPNIGENDLSRKISDIQNFLDKGHKVVVQVQMQGRQVKYSRLAEQNTLDKIKTSLKDVILEGQQQQGNRITATFAKQKVTEQEK